MQNRGMGQGLGATAAAAVLMGALTFALPLLVFGGQGVDRPAQAEPTLPPAPSPVEAPPSPSPAPSEAEYQGTGELDRAHSVKVRMSDGTVEEMDMASYLWGVVAAEMPAGFEVEALKAQTAAARTYTLWKALHNKAHPEANVCTDYTCCQAWTTREEAMEKWGEHGAEYAAKLDRAVSETDGAVLYYDGQPIQAVFHSSSAGHTQDAVAVWGSTAPYLVGVDTPEGEETPNYHTQEVRTAEEVRGALEPLGCKLDEEEPENWLKELTYSAAGSVLTAKVGGVELRGNVLRTALGLRSPSFTASYSEGSFTFQVTGYGHGVGLSQYGANALARQGKTWQEILRWYYTGVELGSYEGPVIPAEASNPPPSDGG